MDTVFPFPFSTCTVQNPICVTGATKVDESSNLVNVTMTILHRQAQRLICHMILEPFELTIAIKSHSYQRVKAPKHILLSYNLPLLVPIRLMAVLKWKLHSVPHQKLQIVANIPNMLRFQSLLSARAPIK